MLTIRSDQIQAFDSVADAMFIDRVAQYLKEHHATVRVQAAEASATVQELSDQTLYEFVRNGIARGRAYGMTHESGLAAFIVLQFETAPNFDEHPLLQRILKDERIEPNIRIDQLMDRATEQNWQAVRDRYDASAWHGPSQRKFDGQTTLTDASEQTSEPSTAEIPRGHTNGERERDPEPQ